MANRYQVRANDIIGRPSDAEFWKHTSAKTICENFDRLTDIFSLPEDRAAEIIVAIWNAACEEYGE